MNRRIFVAALAGALVAPAAAHAQKLRVVTSTTDLRDIASAVGGNRVATTHIAAGYQDPHFVDAKPSFVLQLRKADAFAYVGLDLEIGWMSTLLDGARNRRINRGSPGNIDVSSVHSRARRPAHRRPLAGRRTPSGKPALLARPGEREANRTCCSAIGSPSSTRRARRRTPPTRRGFMARVDSTTRALAPQLAAIRASRSWGGTRAGGTFRSSPA